MKLAVLTSSRADYGIYLPLLKRMKSDATITFSIIAFGAHCSLKFGNTFKQIENDGFKVSYKISNLLDGDSPTDIAKSFANTVDQFAEFWSKNNHYDWVLCLGDRFEMAAAVTAGIPFGINFAHIHAGETTLGAIDNIYRHQISLASRLHFVSTEIYAIRIHNLLNTNTTTEIIGALSLENIHTIPLLDKKEFQEKWDIDLNFPTILMTIHPETVNFSSNKDYIEELHLCFPEIISEHQVVITLPNADTNGSQYRLFFKQLSSQYKKKIHLIENFGTQSYFTCMHYSDILIGNTSSGIIEAASFQKFVINLGNRQAGRCMSKNVISTPFNHLEILSTFHKIKDKKFKGENCYYKKDPSLYIIKRLKREQS